MFQTCLFVTEFFATENKVITIPDRRSRARKRIDSSLSSRHWRIKSLWACTLLGWVLRILFIARRPKYFTENRETQASSGKNYGAESILISNSRGSTLKSTHSFGQNLQWGCAISEHITGRKQLHKFSFLGDKMLLWGPHHMGWHISNEVDNSLQKIALQQDDN